MRVQGWVRVPVAGGTLAALATVLAACGGGSHGVGPALDAPPADSASGGGGGGGGSGGGGGGMDGGTMAADAGITADAADAPVASIAAVTVIVMRDGVPVPNVHTYFITRDGVLPIIVDTDASGKAVTFMDLSVLLAGTASVTVVDAFPDDITSMPRFDHLRTVAGLRPNDQIFITEDSTRTVTVKVPVVAGADNYTVQATCGQGSLSGTQIASGSVTLSCSATDLLVLARQGSTLLKSLYHPGVTASAGQTIDLTSDSYQDPGSLAFDETGLLPSTTGLDVVVGFNSPKGAIDDAVQVNTTVVNGMASGTLAVPATPAVGRISSILTLATSAHVVSDVGAITSPYVLDASTSLLRNIAQRPVYDFSNHRVTWVEGVGGATPEFCAPEIHVTRPAAPGAPARDWQWDLVAPYTAGQVSIPLLPGDVLPWTPVSTDSVSVTIINEKTPISYDLVRAHIFDKTGAAQLDLSGRTVLVGSGTN